MTTAGIICIYTKDYFKMHTPRPSLELIGAECPHQSQHVFICVLLEWASNEIVTLVETVLNDVKEYVVKTVVNMVVKTIVKYMGEYTGECLGEFFVNLLWNNVRSRWI